MVFLDIDVSKERTSPTASTPSCLIYFSVLRGQGKRVSSSGGGGGGKGQRLMEGEGGNVSKGVSAQC